MDLTTRLALIRTLQLTRLARLPDASDDDVLAALASVGVCIVADESNLAAPAAQGAVATLTGLVLACGINVRLAMPPAELRGHQPPLVGSDLRAALVGLGADSVPGVSVEVTERPRRDDLVFVIGDSPWSGPNDFAWRLTASPWSGQLLPASESASRILGEFPIGALSAAAAAAAEPYRAALRLVAARTGREPLRPSYLLPVVRASIDLAPAGTPLPVPNIGSIDLVSGGAIISNALHALFRLPDIRARFRVWDPQALDGSNLNRYLLMRRSMRGMPKAEALKRWAPAGVTVDAIARQVDEVVLRELGELAPHVLVGVDNLEARWLVQSFWPRWLAVAGTAQFMVVASEHEPGMPCARCLHGWTENVPGDIPTISFVSYWAGLLLASRLLRHLASGAIGNDAQATEAWPDRLDSILGNRHLPVQREPDCPLCG